MDNVYIIWIMSIIIWIMAVIIIIKKIIINNIYYNIE